MQESLMEQLWQSAHLSGGSVDYVEELYETYLRDPNAVPEDWRDCFDKLPQVNGSINPDVPHSTIIENFVLLGKNKKRVQPISSSAVSTEHERRQIK